MATGTVKWFNDAKGFGFINSDEGEDVFVHVSTLPAGVPSLKPGTKVEFGIVDGKRGKQALTVAIIGPPPSIVKSSRKDAGDLAGAGGEVGVDQNRGRADGAHNLHVVGVVVDLQRIECAHQQAVVVAAPARHLRAGDA